MTRTGARIRVLDGGAVDDVELVARRMRQTLVEVLGEEQGGALYTHDWLVNRVRQHLDPGQLTGEVFVAESTTGEITGHVIVRLDADGDGNPIGLFSTVFVAEPHRHLGVATALLARGEQWMREHGMTRAVTYTHEDNEPLHRLFAGRGYALSPMSERFVALSKSLTAPGSRG